MNKLLLVLAGVLALGTTAFLLQRDSSNLRWSINNDINVQWKLFKSKFQKRYADPITEAYRLKVFAENYLLVLKDTTGTFGVTKFSDMTDDEFTSTYLNLKVQREVNTNVVDETSPNGSDDINWVTKGGVSNVKDQGACGSCWAFSTTGSVESALIISGYANTNIDLSEQQLVDCSVTNYGCNGGWMDNAFEYIETNPLTTNSNYPYAAVDQPCASSEILGTLYTLKTYTDVDSGDIASLKQSLQQQPISVAVDASNWNRYKGGVLTSCGTSLNHGVLLVGYNSSDNTWLVKNSWGTNWGEKGYIRLAGGNTCGIALAASFPTILPPITSE